MFDRLRRRLAGRATAPAPTAAVRDAGADVPGPAGPADPPDPAALAELAERVGTLLLPGFRDRSDVEEVARDVAEDLGLDPRHAAEETERLWTARLAEQAGWPDRTDADRVADAFDHLDRAGVVARMAFTCCTTCGFAEIGDERPGDRATQGFVFFHDQDAERLGDPGADLYLAFGGWETTGEATALAEADRRVGELVRAALLAEGLTVDWDGDPGARVVVRDLDWRRRLPA